MRKQIFSIAVAAAFAIPTLASAEVEVDKIDESNVLVTYDLKEVSTDPGRKELERQIRRAADRVCGPRTVREAGTLQQVQHNRDCYNSAIASAMKSVETASLAAATSN